jgi:outer membrane lipoprotein carrier protein
MKKLLSGIALSGVFLAGMSQLALAAPDAPRQQLNKFFTQMNSLKGNFSQQVYSKKGQVIQNAKGTIALNRPGKFRWVYTSPDPQTIVADGKNIWIYDEDLEQVTIKPMRAAMSAAPIALLTRKQSPDAQFIVKSMNNKAGGLNWFQLTPRHKSKDFSTVQIGLNSSGIRQMIMFDQLGQKTVIQLNVKSNVPISGNTFFFKPPAGVDVIGKAS